MTTKFIPHDFIPDENADSKFSAHDFSPESTEEVPQETSPSILETALRSGAEGATMGLSGELLGAGSTALETAKGNVPLNLDALLTEYRKQRNESDTARELAAEANPKTAFASELGGGLATMAIPGLGAAKAAQGASWLAKAGLAAKEGAKVGALLGAGTSNAELTKGEIGKFAEDTGYGALVGGATGAAIPIVGSAIKATGRGIAAGAKMIPGMEDLIALGKEAYKEGRILSAPEMGQKLRDATDALYDKIESAFRGLESGKAYAREMADQIGEKIAAGESFEKAFKESKDIVTTTMGKADKAHADEQLAYLERQLAPESKQVNKLQEQADKLNIKAELEGKEGISHTVDSHGNRPILSRESLTPEGDIGLTIKKVGDEILNKPLGSVKVSEIDQTIADLESQAKPVTNAKVLAVYERLIRDLRTQRRNVLESAVPGTSDIFKKESSMITGKEAAGITDSRALTPAQEIQDKQQLFKYMSSEGLVPEQVQKDFYKNISEGADIAAEKAGVEKYRGLANTLYGVAAKDIPTSAPSWKRTIFTSGVQSLPVGYSKLEKVLTTVPDLIKQKAPQFASVIDKATSGTQQQRAALLMSLYSNPAFRSQVKDIMPPEDDNEGQR